MAPLAQMIAVRVDQRRSVLRCPDQTFRLTDAGIAFNGVQPKVEPTRALQQANTLVEQIVDLLPALPGGEGTCAHLCRWTGLGPAGTVRGHLLQDRLGQVFPDVPTVANLQRAGQRAADRFGVGAGTVSAHHLHARVLAQPRLQRGGQTVGQHVDALAGLRVDQDGGVPAISTDREVVDLPRHRSKSTYPAAMIIPMW